jgi:8-oxo-dGTP diphosphatase
MYLVRHAKAGNRQRWQGDDAERPLSKAGRRQADALVDLLAPDAPTVVLSSPYVRCVQTVAPLAAKLGLDVQHADALVEGASSDESWHLVLALAAEDAVLCTHGDVIGDVLLRAETRGVDLPGRRLEKGGVWVLDFDDGRPRTAKYVPPPQVA